MNWRLLRGLEKTSLLAACSVLMPSFFSNWALVCVKPVAIFQGMGLSGRNYARGSLAAWTFRLAWFGFIFTFLPCSFFPFSFCFVSKSGLVLLQNCLCFAPCLSFSHSKSLLFLMSVSHSFFFPPFPFPSPFVALSNDSRFSTLDFHCVCLGCACMPRKRFSP